MRFHSFFILVCFLFLSSKSEAFDTSLANKPIISDSDSIWVDSVLNSLTLEQKIGQLFMVAAYSNKENNHRSEIEQLIMDYHIGGLMFMQGGPIRQVRLTNHYQSLSHLPLMIAQDAEWGVSMRIDSTLRFPWQMTLGALEDDTLIYEMGKEVARECKRLGVHINFAPVVDVNSNPHNPIINNRSFGESSQRVAHKSLMYMKGLQDAGILACAKHFPGHGDTDADSHKTLPTLLHDKQRLDSVELMPFNHLINNGLGSIMVAHLHIPSLDKTDSLAATLSKKVVGGLLKNKLSFNGLIFTDALNMKGVSQFYEPGDVDLMALLAGNDVLLFSQDVPKAVEKIKKAIDNKKITEEDISNRCRKILMAKYWFGLHNYTPIKEENIYNDLNSEQSQYLISKQFEKAITLLQNNNQLLPLKSLDTLNIAIVCVGENSTHFEQTISKYAPNKVFYISEKNTEEERTQLLNKLLPYNLVIASIHKSNEHAWKSYHIDKETDIFLQTLALQSKLILSVFANPYSLSDLLMTYSFDGLVLGYQNSPHAQRAAAQLIFGGIGSNAKIPVSNTHFNEGDGMTSSPMRLKYSHPLELGIDPKTLLKVDSIVNDAIEQEAIPGCQLLAIKDGMVFYDKSFGFHTYKKKTKVKETDLYDLASLTKIIATVPMLMRMVDNQQLDLDDPLSNFLSLADTSSKKDLSLRQILAHQSGLTSWIPFYLQTIDENNQLRDTLYSTIKTDKHFIQVANDLFLHYEYPDSILQYILNSPLKEQTYRYSDLGFYLFKQMIEDSLSKAIDELVSTHFYSPLGMSTMGYLPLERFDSIRIVPTEFDYYFRSQLLQGYVHDMGAAMLGGVGGHAGLFSNANDLGIFMQMYLQNGNYGGERYFDERTVEEFTACQYCEDQNRRGAGFDKAALKGQEGGPACDCGPSNAAFGHSGFTGTLVWADPEEQFAYVFLSNRIHPTSDNKTLLELNVRTHIMEVFYEAIRNAK